MLVHLWVSQDLVVQAPLLGGLARDRDCANRRILAGQVDVAKIGHFLALIRQWLAVVLAEPASTERLVLFLWLLIFLRRLSFTRQVIVEDLMGFLFFLIFCDVLLLLLLISLNGVGLSFCNLLNLR